MNMTNLNSLTKWSKNDELYTPAYAVRPLLKYIPKHYVIWECTDFGASKITKVFAENGYTVVSTHIHRGFDFLKDKQDFDFDIIITNPPFSMKDEFIKKCYEYGKPWVMLLPISALQAIGRTRIFHEKGIQYLGFNERIDFTGGGANWKPTAWFCWKVLPQDLMFYLLKKSEMIEVNYDERLAKYI
jgi:hypothetical protein